MKSQISTEKLELLWVRTGSIHLPRGTRRFLTLSGATVNIPVDASKVQITKLKLDRSRQELIDRKAAGRAAATGKLADGKHSESSLSNMSTVD